MGHGYSIVEELAKFQGERVGLRSQVDALTARLAEAERLNRGLAQAVDEAEAAKIAAWESAGRWKGWKDAAEAKLAKAEAVVTAAERLVSPEPHMHEGMPPGTSCTATHFPTTRRDELRRALATYRQPQIGDSGEGTTELTV